MSDANSMIEAAQLRITELERWQGEATGCLAALETERDEAANVIASQRRELVVLEVALRLASRAFRMRNDPWEDQHRTDDELAAHFIGLARKERDEVDALYLMLKEKE